MEHARRLGWTKGGFVVIDHVALDVRDLEASRRFYEQALRPLGFQVVSESESFCGLGTKGQTRLGLRPGGPSGPVHFAFTSPDRRTVDAFHEAAIAAGGRDNGPPGVRTAYHENYYAAFVRDPDGNNVEAVCETPE
jgi:catechol 2,3-dioxygenase-like lactoylglutathione lyase family enzyme